MRARSYLLISCGALLILIVCFHSFSNLRMSGPGRLLRFFLGEPRITQWVNDTADQIISEDLKGNLYELSENIMAEFSLRQNELKKSEFSDGRIIPIERLPILYMQFNSIFGPPELLFFPSSDREPASIAISWGHMREAIIVFRSPPTSLPSTFYMRKVNENIFVIAGE